VLSPVRDIAGWFSDTIHAKSEVASLRKENQKLTQLLDQAQYAEDQNSQLRRLVGLDSQAGISAYSPLAASVIERDPVFWYETVEVDKGRADGVRVGDPVIGDRGLVGVVAEAGPNFSVVTELLAPKFAAAAMVEDGAGDTGVLVPAVGQPNQLVLQNLPSHANIQPGQQVVTTGFRAGKLTDLFPAGIPIGTVSNANQNTLINNQQVQVKPLADLLHLGVVQILTRPLATTQRASLPAG
jgi:rod shape-determining protein MreC